VNRIINSACIAALAAIAACGGGGGGGGQSNAPSGMNSLIALSAEPSGEHCGQGGTKVEAGLDVNRDGVLENGEVSSTQYVCAGVNGADGSEGAPGANGTTGATGGAGAQGPQGATGENGAQGPAGNTGAQGSSTLLRLSAETAGANCPYGGTRVDAGLDSDGNGVLNASEVTSTNYVCRTSAARLAVNATTLQAAPNTDYVATSASLVALTLPASPSVGDTVSVTGAGIGGWKFVQNVGQSIRTGGLPGSPAVGTFTMTAATQQNWWSLATSSDGSTVLSGINGATNGFGTHLYLSNDYGSSWNDVSPTHDFSEAYVAVSSDGRHLVDAVRNGSIWSSFDGGTSWSGSATTAAWTGVALSGDGNYGLAVSASGAVYKSADGGATWTLATTGPGSGTGAVISGDGRVMIANFGSLGTVYSTNSGLTWNSGGWTWSAIALSRDGLHFAATISSGQVYTSNNSGMNLTPLTNSPAGTWTGIAMSDDGTRLMITDGSHTVASTDAGSTWSLVGTTNAHNVALSASGLTAYASTYNGLIWKAVANRTTVGTAGYLAGSQNDAVTLQYVGGGEFIVLTYANNSGRFTIQ
jgi:photosystem II stability/assembly factor-like uncharacterized protein